MRDYIAYAKANCKPRLSEQASQKLIETYITMRQAGSGRGQVSAYPRQLESLIRLAEACAKIRLSDVVQTDDVEEAYRYCNCHSIKIGSTSYRMYRLVNGGV